MDWMKELIKRSKQRYPQIGNAIAKWICANLSIHWHILNDGMCISRKIRDQIKWDLFSRNWLMNWLLLILRSIVKKNAYHNLHHDKVQVQLALLSATRILWLSCFIIDSLVKDGVTAWKLSPSQIGRGAAETLYSFVLSCYVKHCTVKFTDWTRHCKVNIQDYVSYCNFKYCTVNFANMTRIHCIINSNFKYCTVNFADMTTRHSLEMAASSHTIV